MAIRFSALFRLLLFASFVSASPLSSSQNYAAGPCLAVILTLLLLLVLLMISKHLYMKHRRINSIYTRSRLVSSYPGSFAIDSYYRASTSFIRSTTESMTEKTEKIGILVGLFGSPGWETRVKPSVDKAAWKEQQQASFMYQLHTESRRRQNSHSRSQTQNSSIPENRSILGIGRHSSFSLSNVTDTRALYSLQDGTGQTRSRSLRLPSKAYRAQMPRRFSLPSVSRKDVSDALQRTRHSSLKSTKSRRSDASKTSLLGTASLRLVPQTNGLDLPLPLSPKQCSPTILPNLTPPASTYNPKSIHDIVPPLPPLPLLRQLSSVVTAPNNEGDGSMSPPVPFISHPYALAQNPKRKPKETPQNQSELVSESIYSRAVSTAGQYFKPTPPSRATKLDYQIPAPRPPLTSLNHSINFTPLEIPFPSYNLSPPLPNSPAPPVTPVIIAPILKVKTSRPARPRRSTTIGPSPLRTMILPDSSDSESVSQPANERTSRPSSARSSMDSTYSNIGHEPKYRESDDLSRVSGYTNRRSRARRSTQQTEDEEDPNVILGIIRELVEETSDWDSSLFMDETFRTMIENSGVAPSTIPSKRAAGNSEASSGSDTSATLVDSGRSTEVDLALLGLSNFTHRDGVTHILGEREDIYYPYKGRNARTVAKENNPQNNLISFWEDGSWVDLADQR